MNSYTWLWRLYVKSGSGTPKELPSISNDCDTFSPSIFKEKIWSQWQKDVCCFFNSLKWYHAYAIHKIIYNFFIKLFHVYLKLKLFKNFMTPLTLSYLTLWATVLRCKSEPSKYELGMFLFKTVFALSLS